jgi:transposase-like protein
MNQVIVLIVEIGRLSYPKNVREFRQIFATERSCLEYLIQSRWPEGFCCPRCQADSYWFRAQRKILVCQHCRKEISPMAGTLMHRSHIPIQEWFWATYLVSTLTPGISALQLQRQLGLGSYRTAWFLLNRLRRGMVNDSRTKLSELVEADETIIGGPAKAMKGRGVIHAEHKSLVVGAVEVKVYQDKKGCLRERAGRVRLSILPNANESNIRDFMSQNVDKETFIRTDGWRGYSKTALKGYGHENRVVSREQKAHQLAPHIHRVFSNLKAWLNGTHHGVDPKYLPHYLQEFVFRFNRRQTPMAAFQTLLGIASSKPHITLKASKS